MDKIKPERFYEPMTSKQRARFVAMHEYIIKYRLPQNELEAHQRMEQTEAEAGPGFEAWWARKKKAAKLRRQRLRDRRA